MGVELTFRERGELKTMQRGDEGKKSEVSSGWVGLSPAGSEQARAAGGQTDCKGPVTCQQRSALSLTALGCEGKAPGCGQWRRLEGY